MAALPEFSGHTWPLRIILVQTDREWSGLMRYMGATEPRPSASGCVSWFQRDGWNDIITVSIRGERIAERSYAERIALYAHECVHVAQRCRKIIGSKLGSEVEAYLVQGLLLWVIDTCEEWQ